MRLAARQDLGRATELSFSVVSFAETGLKAALGRRSAPADLHERVVKAGVRILGLAPDHGLDSPCCRSIIAIHWAGF